MFHILVLESIIQSTRKIQLIEREHMYVATATAHDFSQIALWLIPVFGPGRGGFGRVAGWRPQEPSGSSLEPRLVEAAILSTARSNA